MLSLRHLALLLAYWGLALSGTNAASEEGSTTSGSCYKSKLSDYEAIFREAFAHKLDDPVSIYINCMAFGQDKQLETAIVSGNSSTSQEVLRITCQGDLLFVLESEREFSTDRNESCLECAAPESTAEEACLTPCADNCDRCYRTAEDCDCTRLMYNIDAVKRAVDGLTEEELGEHEEHLEEAIEEKIEEISDCAGECQEHYDTSEEHGNPHICYPCGIRFCASCVEEHGKRECEECLPHTELYHEGEGECLFGLLAEILHVAEEQEEEEEEEEKLKDQTRIELAVTLPVVSVIVVAVFIFMSFIAHKRYPHIGETGKTRHRNKPPALAEEELVIDDSVFRPRPTVRLR